MNFNNKRILITGGAGYIGSHVCLALKQTQATIAIVDNLSTGFESNIHFGTLHNIDLNDWQNIDQFIENFKPDAVIHFAGSIVVPESVKHPLKYYQNNTANTLNLIRSCEKHHVNNILFSSTAAVYGIPTSGICSETDDLKPINPYGRSKLMTELMLADSAAASNLNYVALRYFNVAGAHESKQLGQRMPDATHLIKIIAQVLTGKRTGMSIYGSDYPTPDGTCIRDYIHVCDLAHAHVLALNYLLEGGESTVFNCGYSKGFSVKEVVDAAKQQFGEFSVIESDRRAGDPPQLIANSERIQNILNWTPSHNDLDLIIRSAIEFEQTIS
ncbi:MAG: UDP-glucose 4-epimerase GalE [Candidatus Marinamargulisbacteria bacterium]